MSSDSGIDFASVQVPVGEPEATAPQATPVVNGQAVDINQLDQFNDIDDIDAGVSVYDKPLPPPDGWHRVALSAVKDGVAKQKRYGDVEFQGSVQITRFTDRDGKLQTHFMIVVDYQINEEGKQGNKQTVREWVGTMPKQVNDLTGTPADTLLEAITGQEGIGKGMTRLWKVAKLHQLLATNPNIWAETEWVLQAIEATPVIDKQTGKPKVKQSGEDKEEYRTFLRGMNQFPQIDGVRQMLDEDPKSQTPARTRFKIANVKPLSAKVG